MASRASGKIILAGEHAVVYGVPALAVGLDRGARAEATPTAQSALWLGQQRVEEQQETYRAYLQILQLVDAPPLSTRVELELPAGVGLGASAAVAVAIAREARQQAGHPEDREVILRAAHAWESVFHGNPSGIDTACAESGGCIRFVRGEGASPVRLAKPLDLAVAIAGPPSPTRDMVACVQRIRDRNPERFEGNLSAIRTLVQNAEHCLGAGDDAGLGTLFNYNQMLLASWFVSTEGIERVCRLAREAGALGSKLTGAGGGGCVIALPPADGAERILDAWRAAGIECFRTRVEETGTPS